MRTVVRATSLALLALLAGADAWAHGGQFRDPYGALPPGRLPQDPLPPPGHGAPDRADRPAQALDSNDWVLWYEQHRARFEDRKRRLWTPRDPRLDVLPTAPPAVPVAWHQRADHVLGDALRARVLPVLVKTAADAKAHPDLRASAILALGKLSHEPKHVALLRALAAGPASMSGVVTESAVCALGLLRRSRMQDQLLPAQLDAVRGQLFAVLEQAKVRRRTRGFAALALGLLANQPGADMPGVTKRLVGALQAGHADADIDVGIFVALGMQDPTTFTPAQRQRLRDAACRGLWGEADLPRITQVHALEALGGVGNDDDLPALRRLLRDRHTSRTKLGRPAMVAFGRIAARTGSLEVRAEALDFLRLLPRKLQHGGVEQRAILAMADIVVADVKDTRSAMLRRTKVGATLLAWAEDGRYIVRPYAALALARIARAIGEAPTDAVEGEFRWKSVELLRRMLHSKKLAPRGRSAAAVGLGLVQDARSVKPLVAIVAATKGNPELRAYAAHALGLIGMPTKPVQTVLRGAVDGGETRLLRREASRAMGLLQIMDVGERVLARLPAIEPVGSRADLLWVLGEVGTDDHIVAQLLAVMQDGARVMLERAVACAALGELGDLEPLRSLDRLRATRNPYDLTDLLREALSFI